MSKTLGQVAYEAARDVIVMANRMSPPPFSGLEGQHQSAYEAAANAIIEECAKALEDVDCNANDPCEVLRALKTQATGGD